MANIPPIQFKRSSTPGSVPTSDQLSVGELAINFADEKIYTKDSDGTIISVGGSAGASLTVDSEGNVPVPLEEGEMFFNLSEGVIYASVEDASGDVGWVNTAAAAAAIIDNTTVNMVYPTNQAEVEAVAGNIFYLENDGTYANWSQANQEGTFSNIGNTNTASTLVTCTLGVNTFRFRATAPSIFDFRFGIGNPFANDDTGLGWTVANSTNNATITVIDEIDSDTQVGNLPNRIRFRGRASEYYSGCAWTVTYRDGSTSTTTTNTTSANQYHNYFFNTDNTKILESVSILVYGRQGTNPGIRDFDFFFPTVYANGFYKKDGSTITAL